MTAPKWRPYLLLLVILLPALATSQRQRIRSNLLWFGYYNTVQFTEKFSLNTDLQVRTKDWANNWSQQLIRSGLSYALSKQFKFTTGGAWFRHAQSNGVRHFFRNEWRPWVELAYGDRWKRSSVMHRLRAEERFMQKVVNGQKTSAFEGISRLRYRFEFQVPVKGHTVTASLVNEFMVHPGHLGKETFLDQNRTFASLNVKMAASTILQAQYMKIFMWRTNNILEDQNVVRFNIHQQFNQKK